MALEQMSLNNIHYIHLLISCEPKSIREIDYSIGWDERERGRGRGVEGRGGDEMEGGREIQYSVLTLKN